MSYFIRPMTIQDTPDLPTIEQSAGELFRTIPELAWIADDGNLSVERHQELLTVGACWVAVNKQGALIAFLSAQTAGDALHIWELSVLRDYQNRGIGRALISEAIDFARETRLCSITLSTFREVPWNGPMYRRLGFETVGRSDCDERLAEILDREIAAGLPGERRCAMRLSIIKTDAI